MLKRVTLSLALLLVLTGCSGKEAQSKEASATKDAKISLAENKQSRAENEKEEADDNAQEDSYSSKIVKGLEISVKQLESSKVTQNEEERILYSFDVKGKNRSDSKKGLGAIDFILTTEAGEPYAIDDTIANFGDELEQDGEITGKMYFSVKPEDKIEKLEYKPLDESLVSWEIK